MKERTRVHRAKAEEHESAAATLQDRPPLGVGAPATRPAATSAYDATARPEEEETAPRVSARASLGHSLGRLDILPRQPAPPAGQPLPPDLESRFAGSLGLDLGSVQVHTDPTSSALAQSLNARAVTLGERIHFGPGEYRPESVAGRSLLAHEVVHVAQQSRASTRAPGYIPDALESEAASLAPRVAEGLPVRASPAPAIAAAAQAATATLVAAPAAPGAAPAAAPGAPQQKSGPADMNIGFNPMDINHRLLRAIDQSQIKFPEPKRHVDFGAVAAALSNLTAAEVREVRKAYYDHEKRSLDEDLFGKGESGFESDLTPDQRMRITALLGGTTVVQGAPAAEADAAAEHKREVDAAELHELLHGDLEKEDIERVMTILRRGLMGNAALGKTYDQLYHVSMAGEFGRLGAAHMIRALNLFMGRAVEADRIVVGGKQLRIGELDIKIAELREDSGPFAFMEIQRLQKERNGLVEEVEQRTEMSVAEARSDAIKQGGDAAAVDQAGRSRAEAVLGNLNVAATTLGGTDAAVIRAIASGDPVAKAAAELRKAAAADKLSASQITTTLRGLREQAEARAKLENPKAGADELAAKARVIAEDYFTRLRSSYNELAGTDMHFNALLEETGDEEEVDVNRALMMGRGHLSDLEELVLALSGDRKDTETVERVLKNKNAGEIKWLKAQYMMRTGGRSLDYDLFGEAPTQAGEENPEMMGRHLKEQGKASGTSRLNLEDYLQRPEPEKEGTLEEVNYIIARAEREYEYTIENRGATGAWRDAWGNEERSLLDETIKEVRGLYWQYFYSAVANPKFPQTAAAHQIIQKMRLARATIRGDRAAYEKATAELRATFEAIAAFALQAALTAVLGPLAELALLGELAEGASVALRVAKLAQTAAVGTASTIGANMAVYGSDYSLAMLKADLLGGMGGALGPAAVDKLVGPYAKALVAKLGPKASAEIIAISKTVAGMETGAWAQGESADLSIEGIAKAHMMGKGGEIITAKVQSGLGLAPPKPGAPPPEHGPEQRAPEPAPAAAAEPAPAASTAAPATAAHPAAAPNEPAPVTLAELPAAKPTAAVPEAAKALPPAPEAAGAPAPAHAPTPEATPAASGAGKAPEAEPAAPPKAAQPGAAERQPPRSGGDEVTQPHARAPASLENIGLIDHSEMPNVLIDKSIPGFEMKTLLSELERTPQGSRIAEQIRRGDVELIITREPIADASGLALGKEMQVTWEGSVAETVSTLVHEGTHNLDPQLVAGGMADTTLSREAIARAFEYEYRMEQGLPPFDAAEVAYREALTAARKSGASAAEANLAAEKAMIEAMRADPRRYSVESPAQEQERMNKLPPLPEPPPATLSPPTSPREQELFGDLGGGTAPAEAPARARGASFEEEPTQPNIEIPEKATLKPRRQRSSARAAEPDERLFRPEQLSGDLVVELAEAGVSARARNAAGGSLSLKEMIRMIEKRDFTRRRSIGPVGVEGALPRGGDESQLHLGSAYGLEDYIRYHVQGPGTGKEGYPIFLTPVEANQFANNHVEGFMRRQRDAGHAVDFTATTTTFGGEELRPFVEGMLRSGDPAILGRLALDRGRIEPFLKSITYDITVTADGQTTRYRASITVGPPGSGEISTTPPEPIR